MPQLRAQPIDASLTQVLEGLRVEGYGGDFFVLDGPSIRCGGCGATTSPADAEVHGLRRIEGVSDPADMAAVLALRCSGCGQGGTAVLRYGPEAGPGDAEVLLAIDPRHGSGFDAAEGASASEPQLSGADEQGSPGGSPDPDEAVGDFGDDDQSDQGGDSDVGPASEG